MKIISFITAGAILFSANISALAEESQPKNADTLVAVDHIIGADLFDISMAAKLKIPFVRLGLPELTMTIMRRSSNEHNYTTQQMVRDMVITIDGSGTVGAQNFSYVKDGALKLKIVNVAFAEEGGDMMEVSLKLDGVDGVSYNVTVQCNPKAQKCKLDEKVVMSVLSRVMRVHKFSPVQLPKVDFKKLIPQQQQGN